MEGGGPDLGQQPPLLQAKVQHLSCLPRFETKCFSKCISSDSQEYILCPSVQSPHLPPVMIPEWPYHGAHSQAPAQIHSSRILPQNSQLPGMQRSIQLATTHLGNRGPSDVVHDCAFSNLNAAMQACLGMAIRCSILPLQAVALQAKVRPLSRAELILMLIDPAPCSPWPCSRHCMHLSYCRQTSVVHFNEAMTAQASKLHHIGSL